MPSHFSSVGIPHDVSMQSVIDRAIADGRHVAAPGGATEVQWRDASGLAVTVTLENGTVTCLKPTVITRSPVRVVPNEIVAAADCGYCSVVLADAVDANGQVCTRLAFELAEHATTAPRLAIEAPVDVSLLAIAHDVVLYRDVAAYDAVPAEPEGLRWAARSWLPLGMFLPEVAGAAAAMAAAAFHGVVTSAEHRTSATFGGSFWLLAVESVMPIDVAVDDTLLAGTSPRAGNVIGVDEAWVVGRLMAGDPPAAAKRSWWARRSR